MDTDEEQIENQTKHRKRKKGTNEGSKKSRVHNARKQNSEDVQGKVSAESEFEREELDPDDKVARKGKQPKTYSSSSQDIRLTTLRKLVQVLEFG